MSDSKRKDPAPARGKEPPEAEENKRGPRISHIAAGICALLVAAAAGAAVVANKAVKEEAPARIYVSSSSAETVGDSSSGTDSGTSSARGASSEGKSESTSEKKTKATVTEKVYEYPQDINKADLDCFLAVSGINKTAAEGITAFRRRRGAIHNFDELLEVYGIGERTLSVIEEHFFISENDRIEYTTASQTSRERKETEVTTTEKVTAVPAVTELPAETVESSEAEPVSEAEKVMKPVNINKADAEEIAECLLLRPEQAEAIVKLRERIGKFSDMREILYTEAVSKDALVERRDYILLEDKKN